VIRLTVFMLMLAIAGGAAAQGPRLIDRADYADRLRGMWLGQCIANWTGLRTEGRRINPPFYTDADWGMVRDGILIDFVLTQNPWLADDDTDVEYVYVHMLRGPTPPTALDPEALRLAWVAHINRFIWVSNARARTLMGRGVVPPMTGLQTANADSLAIDAQLTTEIFGLYCPGMPERALVLADPAIRATSHGYAAHASQFHAVLYALAPITPASLPPADRMRWLFDEARRWIPNTSKTADIADFVLADFLSNPDVNDWERTRDAVYQRYHLNAAANGFRYRNWYESSVNFAGLCAGMLYGQGDYRRTVQICTLFGWDSDNSTATLGGLMGFMLGHAAMTAQFPGTTFSDRFDINRTRDALPDYLPADAAAQDTFTLMAQRMLPAAEAQIALAGGRVDTGRGKWLLPPPIRLGPAGTQALFNPHNYPGSDDARSANLSVRRAGGVVTGTTSFFGSPPGGQGATWNPANLANGLEHDAWGREPADGLANFVSSQNTTPPPANTLTFTVTYDRPVTIHTIRLVEGDHFDTPGQQGGWFESLAFEVRVGGVWTPANPASLTPLDASRPFQRLDAILATPVVATGIRATGIVGGAQRFATAAELDALAPPVAPPWPTFDVNADTRVDLEDLHAQNQTPADVDQNGVIDAADLAYLERALRWMELDTIAPR
jgi:hypothetical protein